METCLIDNSQHQTESDLHRHLRILRVKQETYYTQYFPRKDLLTGEPIKFKNRESYFKTDFNNKNNLKKWSNDNPALGLEWGKNFLARRKQEKGLVYAPSSVELKTLPSLTVDYFQKHSSYAKICQEIGLEQKFDYTPSESFQYKDLAEGVVSCDTREQILIKFTKVKTIIEKLDYGDYRIDSKFDNGIYIEKKSLNDFITSFGKDMDRLTREIERCRAAGHYMVVLVLAPLSRALSFNYSYEGRYSKVSPDFVFANVRRLLKEFYNLQFLFIEKEEAENTILNVFKCGECVRKTDLQYHHDLGLI